MSLSTTVKGIQDIMRKDAGVDGDAQRLSQLVWMLFLKIFEDSEADLEIAYDSYQSPIPEPLRWRNWAADPEGITGDALLGFINNSLFPQLKELQVFGQDSRAIVVREVFRDANNYMKSGTLIRQVINKLGEVNFNKSGDRHQFGDIYEQLLNSTLLPPLHRAWRGGWGKNAAMPLSARGRYREALLEFARLYSGLERFQGASETLSPQCDYDSVLGSNRARRFSLWLSEAGHTVATMVGLNEWQMAFSSTHICNMLVTNNGR